MRDIRRAEREHVALEKLREEREELESVHEKEANKYRNGGRKVREEKAAVRFVEMEKLLERQNRVCMEMNEVQTRLNSHASSKYERAIEKTEARHKLLHDPNFDYARPIGRILMVKLRRLKRDPRALMKVSMADLFGWEDRAWSSIFTRTYAPGFALCRRSPLSALIPASLRRRSALYRRNS